MLRRPPPLTPGAPVAVVAPASPPCSADAYRAGLDCLRATYDVQWAWTPGSERGYLAAPDRDRVAALHSAIEDPDIRALICVRGGYGSLRLLPRIDWSLARQHPTLLVGYSDVTALHLALYAKASWPGLSGPVITEWAQADDATLASFQNWAEGDTPTFGDGFDTSLTALAHGAASGPLLGGNLTVLTRLLGTPFVPDFEGAVLVLEEVAEAPYRVDRMLTHLQQAGVMDAVAGVVLGSFTTGSLDSHTPTLSLSEVFQDHLGDRPYPVVSGLSYGHHLPRCSLPLGVPVHLRATPTHAALEAEAPLVNL
ncbi:S66 peptidase family protein [Salinibacter altiplanensis]|uniref:S66 peptidase family protein n=1 Tax=Salinibacter altiplanensis TaxID=1803181 RepID=UPI000C9F0A18|nr:LD-carboxypeptidase [Salinibacter altiplanensis]